MKPTPTKTVKAWAALIDNHVIYARAGFTKAMMRECFPAYEVVRCTITYVPRKPKRRGRKVGK